MSSPLERIKKLIVFLPTKDIKIAEKFINIRDFESLQELVDSARYKVKKSRAIENSKSEYDSIDLDKLTDLKVEVDAYVLTLNLPPSEWDAEYDGWEDEL